MEEYIINFSKTYRFTYIKIENKQSMEIIYNLLKNNIKLSNINDDIILLYYGIYCGKVEKNYDEMKQYFLAAVKQGNSNALNHLSYYYFNIEKNYDEMKNVY
jgi:TPR repeat protein